MNAFWPITIALIALNVAIAYASSIEITGISTAVLFVSAMLSLYLVYSRIIPRPQIAALANSCAQLLAASAVLCVLTYMVATDRPLIDNQIAAFDKQLGFDWLAFFYWVKAHPNIDLVLEVSYSIMLPQMLITIVVLSATERYNRLHEFVLLYSVTLFITTVFFAFFPAAGAWESYGVANNPTLINNYLPDFHAARGGQLHVLDLSKVHGIVQFPSFHAALALIFVIVARGIRIWFPIAIALNCIMSVSALTHGGHHLADILAGFVLTVAVAALLTYRSVSATRMHKVEASGLISKS